MGPEVGHRGRCLEAHRLKDGRQAGSRQLEDSQPVADSQDSRLGDSQLADMQPVAGSQGSLLEGSQVAGNQAEGGQQALPQSASCGNAEQWRA